MSNYYTISPRRTGGCRVRITQIGTVLLFGAGYEDADISDLFCRCGDNVCIDPMPRSQGITARISGDVGSMNQALAEAFESARKLYAGGFEEPIPA